MVLTLDEMVELVLIYGTKNQYAQRTTATFKSSIHISWNVIGIPHKLEKNKAGNVK